MPAQVLIIHGWSDSSKSFQDLSAFLTLHGFGTKHVWLADYITMEDDVRVEDAARRMRSVVDAALAAGDLVNPFDLIVHSTGGLLAREWIIGLHEEGRQAPVKRLIMLAPANFGSRLASQGKSMLGRVVKGWDDWFQTGTQMLDALELASSYQWNLARRDLFDLNGASGGPYAPDKIWPFVIVGARGYNSGLKQIVNENGSDGTVRGAAANLNAIGLTIDFSSNPLSPKITPWPQRASMPFPFAILPDRDHFTIHEPATNSGAFEELSERLGTLILNALRCENADEYVRLAAAWEDISEATCTLSSDDAAIASAFPSDPNPPQAEALHQYMQVIVFVRDDQGYPLSDFFVEFFSPEEAGSEEAVTFHREVLDDVHVNQNNGSRRCFFIDRTDLMSKFYRMIADPAKRQVAVSISVAELGPNVRYFDSTQVGAKGYLVVHRESDDRREVIGAACLHRNMTHLVEIVIPRQPIDKVFAMS